MAESKKPALFDKRQIVLQAKDGFVHPIRYKGGWVRIRQKPLSFEVRQFAYLAKNEISRAIESGHLIEAIGPGEPAEPPMKLQPGQIRAASLKGRAAAQAKIKSQSSAKAPAATSSSAKET